MAPRLFKFGNYLLDPARRELRLAGQAVELPARAIHCIVHLVEHRERAVSRDELIAAVWRNADVSNNVLDQTMMRARRALGDGGDEKRAIRTIHGFGYAWDIPVEVVGAPTLADPLADAESYVENLDASAGPAGSIGQTAEASTSAVPGSVPPFADAAVPRSGVRRPSRWRSTALVSASLIALVVLVAGIQWLRTPPEAPSRKATAIVLPVGVAPGENQAWMRLGLMDAIAQRLRASGHSVMPVDNVVAVTAGVANPTEKQLDSLLDGTPARVLIRPAVERIEGNRWRVSLEVRRGESFAPGEIGEAADPLTAARIAADRLSASFGIAPRGNSDETPEKLALQQQLQIVDAARLDSRIDDARALLDMLTPLQQADPEAALMRGFVDLADGRFAQARIVFERLLGERSLQSSAFVESRALYGHGVALFHLSQAADSIAAFDKAVALMEADPATLDGDWLGRVIGARAIAHVLGNEAQAALADQARARVLFESAGDTLRLGVLDNNIGWTSLQRNRFREALPALERAAAASVSLNAISVELRARVGIVRAELALLDPERALAQDERIGELIALSPGATVQHLATGWRIRALMANGRLRAADALIRSLSASEDRRDEEQFVPWALGLGAQRAYANGRTEEAAALAAKSLGAGWGMNYDGREYAATLLVLLRAQIALGQRDAAIATLAAARAWTPPDTLSSTAQVYGAVLVAEAQSAGIDSGDARATFERALELADADQTPSDLLEVCGAYARHLIAIGDFAQAAQVVGRVSEWSSRSFDVAALQARLYRATGDMGAWAAAIARANALAGERVSPSNSAVPADRIGVGSPAAVVRSTQALR